MDRCLHFRERIAVLPHPQRPRPRPQKRLSHLHQAGPLRDCRQGHRHLWKRHHVVGTGKRGISEIQVAPTGAGRGSSQRRGPQRLLPGKLRCCGDYRAALFRVQHQETSQGTRSRVERGFFHENSAQAAMEVRNELTYFAGSEFGHHGHFSRLKTLDEV
jgi:hypothetical protein